MTGTTRSGRRFTPFALSEPIICDVDAADLLRARFAELDASADGLDPEERDEELEGSLEDVPTTYKQPECGNGDANIYTAHNTSTDAVKHIQPRPTPIHIPGPRNLRPSTPPSPLSPLTPSPPPSPPPGLLPGNVPALTALATPLSRKARRKMASRLRDRAKRQAQRQADPTADKDTARAHRDSAYTRTVVVDVDAGNLPVNSSGYGGLRRTVFKDKRTAAALVTQPGWRHIHHDGDGSIPLVDRGRHLLVIIGGCPKDKEGWQDDVIRPLGSAIAEGSAHVQFAKKERAHKRGKFAALVIGVSHGGGEQCPGNRRLSPSARAFMEGLLALPAMQRVAGFTNQMLHTYNPSMHAAYADNQDKIHARHRHLRRNFANSVYSSLTVNCADRVITDPHADGANRPDGYCAITCGGEFDHRRGGQLVLWDLKIVVDFPSGCTLYIPSALIVHSNCPVQPGETRFSVTQYSAGGLFRWVDNGFQTQDAFLRNASDAEVDQWYKDRATRWQRGLEMFPVLP